MHAPGRRGRRGARRPGAASGRAGQQRRRRRGPGPPSRRPGRGRDPGPAPAALPLQGRGRLQCPGGGEALPAHDPAGQGRPVPGRAPRTSWWTACSAPDFAASCARTCSRWSNGSTPWPAGPTSSPWTSPSGLSGETGKPSPLAVTADATVAFEAAKTGLVTAEAAPYVGKLLVRGIGIPPRRQGRPIPAWPAASPRASATPCPRSSRPCTRARPAGWWSSAAAGD